MAKGRRPRRLTHVDATGAARMVDVGTKAETEREAVACGRVRMAAETLALIRSGAVRKGDPLHVARLAGIMAAKRTAELIPLCHPLGLTSIDVDLEPVIDGYTVRACARTVGRTGVEMEALTAVAVACLTLYDMVKAVDRGLVIDDISLVSKRGGRSGEYVREAVAPAGRARRANPRRSAKGPRSRS